ncbi:MAG: AAA family ATPase, partial [Acidimicrobiales bacterium]
MRPLTLEMEGFGSYSSPTTLDLSEVDAVVVVGENGAGKSTILDAVLYAICGHTRSGDADSVVATAMDRAEVKLTFAMGGQRWRASRTRHRGKRTTALLEVLGEDGTWAPRGAEGVRGVDAALADLLGLSTEALMSTAFCMQGDSARFSCAQPRRRKEILSELLGLDRYATWAQAARDRARDARGCQESLGARVADADEKLSGRDAITAEMGKARQDAEDAATGAAKAQAGLDALAAEVARRERLAGIETRLVERVKAREAEQADAARSLEAARKAAEAATGRRSSLVSRAAELAAQAQAPETDVEVATDKVTALSTAEAEVVEAGQKVRSRIDLATAEGTRWNEVAADATARLDVLSHEGEGTCWACGQGLTPELLADLTERVRAEVTSAESAARAASQQAEAAGAERAELLSRLATTRASLAQAR